MKISCKVDDLLRLVPEDKDRAALLRAVDVGITVDISLDTERQRSTIQRAKYWAEINDICSGMREDTMRLLLSNLVAEIAKTEEISPEFFHAALKAAAGIDSINLTKNNREVRGYFDFAFRQLERIKGALVG